MKMNIRSIYSQFRANIVAIVSVIVALTGMAYNTYRNFFPPARNDVLAGFRTCAR